MITRCRILFGFAFLLCLSGIAVGRGGGASSDPYYLAPVQNLVTVPRASLYNLNSGYTPQVCSSSLGTKRVIIYVGQSVTANNVNTTYAVTQANNWMMDIQSGGCYTAKDPVLGATVSGGAVNIGSYGTEVADQLISGGTAAHVITVNAAVGGTTVADWATGGYLFPSIAVIGRRLTQQGLTCTNIVWGQGENDHGTSAPNYTTRLTSVITEFRNQGMSCPFHVLVETMLNGVVDSTVAGAQAAMTGTNVFVGFNMDTGVPNSGGNRYDGTHLSSTGRDLAAPGVKANIAAH